MSARGTRGSERPIPAALAGRRTGTARNAAFERMLRLAARDARARALVVAAVENSGLAADERDAILRDFLADADEPDQD